MMAVLSTTLLKLSPQPVYFFLKAFRVRDGFLRPLAFLIGPLAFFIGPLAFFIRTLDLSFRLLAFREEQCTR